MLRFHIGSTPVSIERQQFERFSVPGPRYTSYPPVPAWRGDFSPTDHARALADAAATHRSVYVHIPFCRKRCLYCGCNVVVTARQERAEAYVQTLEKEIALTARHLPDNRPVIQFHWGGGTPTYLTPDQMRRVWTALADHFPVASRAEISVEIDPRVTTLDHLETLRDLGFNRLSMGVQDFDPDVQQTIRRENSPAMVRMRMHAARRMGFRSINLDLMYGLPKQTPESFARTLDEVIAMEPDRLALFSYAHLPARFKHQRALPEETIPVGWDKLRLFTMGVERLTGAGWRFIGFDHFARPDDDLARAHDQGTLHRNFMGYTTHAGTDLIAFGASGISGLTDAHVMNHRDVPGWSAAIEAGELPTHTGHWLSSEDRLRGEVIMQLLCNDRIVRTQIESRFAGTLHGRTFDDWFADALRRLQPLAEEGFLVDDGSIIQVTPAGRLFARTAAMCFDPTTEALGTSTMQRTA